MVNNIFSARPNPKEDGTTKSDSTKPQTPPRNDNFNKTLRKEGKGHHQSDRIKSKDSPRHDFRRPVKDGSSKRKVDDKLENQEEHLAEVDEHDEPPSLFDLSKSAKPKDKSPLSGKSPLKGAFSSELASQRPIAPKQGNQQPETHLEDMPEDLETMPEDLETMPEDLYAAADEPTPKESFPIKKTMDQPQSPTMDPLKQQAAASALQQKPLKESSKESSLETGKLDQSSKKQKTGRSEELKREGATEIKGDVAGAVNASIQSVGFQTETPQATQEPLPPATIRELATQIIDRIQIMRRDNETQTTITLRHPPILEGATITLTANDNAKREFNIAFANLSPEAKLLLDQRMKEDSLTDALGRKGITVHILTTSTQVEQSFNLDTGQSSRDRQEQQQQQQQQQKRQNSPDSEEEEVT